MNIFITAGSSSAGLALIRQLVGKGHKVIGTASDKNAAAQVRNAGGLPTYPDLLSAGEIRSAMLIAKPDVVVHFAPQLANGVPFFPNLSFDVLKSTQAALEAAQAVGATAFIHTSMVAAYGDTHGDKVDESTHLNGSTALAKAAKAAEELVLASEMKTCVLRAGYVYSATDNGLVEAGAKLRRGSSVPAGTKPASWTNAADLANAAALAIEKEVNGEVFNIVDDATSSPVEFLNLFSSALGLGERSASEGVMTKLFGGSAALDLMDVASLAGNAKAKEVLGWKPKFADQLGGIEEVLLDWRATMV